MIIKNRYVIIFSMKNIIFRKAQLNDLDQIITIINQAISYFKSKNIDQWQDGYPNIDVIKEDILNNNSYVLISDHKILATCMISKEIEPTYNQIDGKWLGDLPYIVIHRIAIKQDSKNQGLASLLLKNAFDLYPNYRAMRIDTHKDNLVMQKFLLKQGFTYCGTIVLKSGSLRNAYEKLLKEK